MAYVAELEAESKEKEELIAKQTEMIEEKELARKISKTVFTVGKKKYQLNAPKSLISNKVREGHKALAEAEFIMAKDLVKDGVKAVTEEQIANDPTLFEYLSSLKSDLFSEIKTEKK